MEKNRSGADPKSGRPAQGRTKFGTVTLGRGSTSDPLGRLRMGQPREGSTQRVNSGRQGSTVVPPRWAGPRGVTPAESGPPPPGKS